MALLLRKHIIPADEGFSDNMATYIDITNYLRAGVFLQLQSINIWDTYILTENWSVRQKRVKKRCPHHITNKNGSILIVILLRLP